MFEIRGTAHSVPATSTPSHPFKTGFLGGLHSIHTPPHISFTMEDNRTEDMVAVGKAATLDIVAGKTPSLLPFRVEPQAAPPGSLDAEQIVSN